LTSPIAGFFAVGVMLYSSGEAFNASIEAAFGQFRAKVVGTYYDH